jgi:protocatechuate 3,4-dioxygenase beta subunit
MSAEGATAAALPAQASPTVAAAALPSCVVRPELTEGPYFVDEKLDRSDIRSDPTTGEVKQGIPLQLAFAVSQVNNGCTPLAGAQVDIWHCDAAGVYSDASDPGFNTKGQKFLRGYQVTDSNGKARFTTIYPGWYQGRAVHIHFKIRTNPASQAGYEFISQLFFDESITDQVHAQQPYAAKGQRTLLNEGDGIYRNGGSQLLIAPAKSGDGYAVTFDIGLQMG